MRYLKTAFVCAYIATCSAGLVNGGTASATELDCGEWNCGYEATILASAELNVELHPAIGSIECKWSNIGMRLNNPGSSTTTASGSITTFNFESCNATVTVLKKGTLEVHTKTSSSDGNGTLTSSGAEVTVVFAGFHCIFSTNKTDIGTLTGTKVSFSTVDLEATIPRTGGSSGIFCGSTAQWTGSYSVWSPAAVTVT